MNAEEETWRIAKSYRYQHSKWYGEGLNKCPFGRRQAAFLGWNICMCKLRGLGWRRTSFLVLEHKLGIYYASSKWRCHFSREALFLGQIGHRINKLKSRRILAILLSFFYLFRNFLFKKIERHMWFQKYFGSTMKHWHVFLTLRSRHADTGVVILDCATRWLFIEYLADYSQIYFRLLILCSISSKKENILAQQN